MIFVLTFTVGCSLGKTDEPPEAKIQKMFAQMNSYQATCTVTFIAKNTQNTFKMIQYAKMTGEYRMEMLEPERLKNTVTVCNGDKIVQIDNRVGGKVYVAKPSPVRNLVLLNSFIENYLQGEDVTITASAQEDNVTELEAIIPGNHPYLARHKLWVDNESLSPLQMSVYDENGNETIVVQFEDFEYNVELPDDLFKIPGLE